jgi:hypothetical protein
MMSPFFVGLKFCRNVKKKYEKKKKIDFVFEKKIIKFSNQISLSPFSI